MQAAEWAQLNRAGIFEDPGLLKYAAPFPSSALMHSVSSLENERDFAAHGADLFLAISQVSPRPLASYRSLLDFGCGCGRFTRMLKGHPHGVWGCDINGDHVEWVQSNLDYVQASRSPVVPPLAYSRHQFDAVVAISVFTHLNEESQDQFLCELARIAQPGACLFLTVHGERAMQRALQEEGIMKMLAVDPERFQKASQDFARGQFAFVLQTESFERQSLARRWAGKLLPRLAAKTLPYGMTFHPPSYIHTHWSRWFRIQDIHAAAIHDFQDIVVLLPRQERP